MTYTVPFMYLLYIINFKNKNIMITVGIISFYLQLDLFYQDQS